MTSTLELIIAQRLVRTICSACKMSQTYSKEYLQQVLPNLENHFTDDSTTLYKGKGCQVCKGTGYKGRTAIFEFIQISEAMKELIMQNPPVDQIRALAKKTGARAIFEDGMTKVQNGTTTLEELLRVASP